MQDKDLKELEDKISKLEVSLLVAMPKTLYEDFMHLGKLHKEYAHAKGYKEGYKEGRDYEAMCNKHTENLKIALRNFGR